MLWVWLWVLLLIQLSRLRFLYAQRICISLDQSKIIWPFSGHYFAQATKMQSVWGYLGFWKGARLWQVSHSSAMLCVLCSVGLFHIICKLYLCRLPVMCKLLNHNSYFLPWLWASTTLRSKCHCLCMIHVLICTSPWKRSQKMSATCKPGGCRPFYLPPAATESTFTSMNYNHVAS